MKKTQKIIDYMDLSTILPKKGTILISHAASVPTGALRWIVQHHEFFEKLYIIHMNPKGNVFYTNPKISKTILSRLFFVSKFTQQAVHEKVVEFIPIHFSETPLYVRSTSIDAYITPVSRTIKNKISLGVSVDYEVAGLETAKIAIGVQSKHIPYTIGDGEQTIKRFDYLIVDDSLEPAEIELSNKYNDIIHAIADNVAQLIDDGSVIQAGVGTIPDAILKKLRHKKDLGIHTEMMTDGMMELIQSGNVTNKTKKIDKGVSVATFAYGTQKLYSFLDNNAKILFKTVDYTNSPSIISKNDKAISINSAVQVDLTGQVNAEMINNVQLSGVGGQIDFIRGVRMSHGGKSIIAFPSTNSDGSVSRIVDKIGKDGIITTSRNDVNYVCTEYGCVNLSNKTLNERKKLLISISHPNFRKQLAES